jgi:hypothetical protein
MATATRQVEETFENYKRLLKDGIVMPSIRGSFSLAGKDEPFLIDLSGIIHNADDDAVYQKKMERLKTALNEKQKEMNGVLEAFTKRYAMPLVLDLRETMINSLNFGIGAMDVSIGDFPIKPNHLGPLWNNFDSLYRRGFISDKFVDLLGEYFVNLREKFNADENLACIENILGKIAVCQGTALFPESPYRNLLAPLALSGYTGKIEISDAYRMEILEAYSQKMEVKTTSDVLRKEAISAEKESSKAVKALGNSLKTFASASMSKVASVARADDEKTKRAEKSDLQKKISNMERQFQNLSPDDKAKVAKLKEAFDAYKKNVLSASDKSVPGFVYDSGTTDDKMTQKAMESSIESLKAGVRINEFKTRIGGNMEDFRSLQKTLEETESSKEGAQKLLKKHEEKLRSCLQALGANIKSKGGKSFLIELPSIRIVPTLRADGSWDSSKDIPDKKDFIVYFFHPEAKNILERQRIVWPDDGYKESWETLWKKSDPFSEASKAKFQKVVWEYGITVDIVPLLLNISIYPDAVQKSAKEVLYGLAGSVTDKDVALQKFQKELERNVGGKKATFLELPPFQVQLQFSRVNDHTYINNLGKVTAYHLMSGNTRTVLEKQGLWSEKLGSETEELRQVYEELTTSMEEVKTRLRKVTDIRGKICSDLPAEDQDLYLEMGLGGLKNGMGWVEAQWKGVTEKAMTSGNMGNMFGDFKEILAPYSFHGETILDSLLAPTPEVTVDIEEEAPTDREKTRLPESGRISMPGLKRPAPPREESPARITEAPALKPSKPSPSSPKASGPVEENYIPAFEGWKVAFDSIPPSGKAAIRYPASCAKPVTAGKAVLGENYRSIDSPCIDGDNGLWALLFSYNPAAVCDKIDKSERSKSFVKVVFGFRAKAKKNAPTSNIGNPGTYTTPEQLKTFAELLGKPLAILKQDPDKSLYLIDFNDVSTKEWKHNPTKEDGKRLEKTYKNDGILLLLTENTDESGQIVRRYRTLVHRDRVEPAPPKGIKASPTAVGKKRPAESPF